MLDSKSQGVLNINRDWTRKSEIQSRLVIEVKLQRKKESMHKMYARDRALCKKALHTELSLPFLLAPVAMGM